MGEPSLEDWTEEDQSWDFGAGGMMSTVSDLSRFMTLLIGGSVVSPQSLEEMMTLGPNGKYGLGITRQANLGWGHTGGVAGYLSIASYDPATGFAVAGCVTLEPSMTPFVNFYAALQNLKERLGY